MAAFMGFSDLDCGEIAIVISELAVNILKYGIRGQIDLEGIDDPVRGPGLRVTARDEGPPLDDFHTALMDGHKDGGPIDPATLFGRRGIGMGLGAVLRLTDHFEYRGEQGAKAFVATRFRRRQGNTVERRHHPGRHQTPSNPPEQG